MKVLLFFVTGFSCLGLSASEVADVRKPLSFFTAFTFSFPEHDLQRNVCREKQPHAKLQEEADAMCSKQKVYRELNVNRKKNILFFKSATDSLVNVAVLPFLDTAARYHCDELYCGDICFSACLEQLSQSFPNVKKIRIEHTNIVVATDDKKGISEESLSYVCGKPEHGSGIKVCARGYKYVIPNLQISCIAGKRLKPGDILIDIEGVEAHVQRSKSGNLFLRIVDKAEQEWAYPLREIPAVFFGLYRVQGRVAAPPSHSRIGIV